MFVRDDAALTLAPALLTVAAGSDLLEPKRRRRPGGGGESGRPSCAGPGRSCVASIAVTLVGLLALPSLPTSYDDKQLPAGRRRGERRIRRRANGTSPQARLNPEVLMLVADHDLRNPTDMLIIDKVAKDVFHLPGIGRVQTITRPLGTPIERHLHPVHRRPAGREPEARTSPTRRTARPTLLTQAADISRHDRHPDASSGTADPEAPTPSRSRPIS